MEWLARLLGGPLLQFIGGPIADKILDGYKAKLSSVDQADGHALDLAKAEISADIAARSNAKEIRLATSGLPEVRALFFAIGCCFGGHAGAVCVGSTFAGLLPPSHWLLHVAALPAPFDAYEGQVVMFFFGSAVALTGVQAIAAALARRA